jgi:hypothetical protein
VLWNDLYVTQGSVYTHYDAARFVISYIGVPRLSAGSPQTFQVILYPSGRIVYQYLTCTGTWDTDATVGIQNATGSDGLTVEYNAAYLHNNLAVELGTMPDFLTVTPVAGTVPAGDSLDLTVTFDATDLSEGDYRAELSINSNDPVESTVLVPAHLKVVAQTYTLDVTVVGSGTVGKTPDLAGYAYGSTVTLEALPEAGFSFSGWSGDTTATENPITLTMYANKSVTATFAASTGVGDGPVVALAVRPSPMRGTGRLGFVLPRAARARLSVLDLQGREIAVLADGAFPAGRHTAMWDGSTKQGSAPAGLYFVRLSAEGRVFSQRLVRLK